MNNVVHVLGQLITKATAAIPLALHTMVVMMCSDQLVCFIPQW